MFRILVFFGVVTALLLALFAVWSDRQDDYASSGHTHTITQVASDHTFDNDLTLFNEDSALTIIDGIRPLRLVYVDKDGNPVGAIVVPGLVVSNDYVVASRLVLPNAEDGITLGQAQLLAVPEDGAVSSEILGAPTAVDKKILNLVAFPRPQTATIPAVPLTLGASQELAIGNQLIASTAHGTNSKGVLVGLVAISPAGVVQYRSADTSRVFFTGVMPVGTPLFALRDGKPELVGLVVGRVDTTLGYAINTEVFAEYLKQLGISVPSQQP